MMRLVGCVQVGFADCGVYRFDLTRVSCLLDVYMIACGCLSFLMGLGFVKSVSAVVWLGCRFVFCVGGCCSRCGMFCFTFWGVYGRSFRCDVTLGEYLLFALYVTLLWINVYV